LLEQLAPGGRIVLPLGGDEVQQLSVVTRQEDGSAAIRPVLPVRFTRLETMG
jgi:protein-L-isoaspartate(D-aspartate) O-methyltransferase